PQLRDEAGAEQDRVSRQSETHARRLSERIEYEKDDGGRASRRPSLLHAKDASGNKRFKVPPGRMNRPPRSGDCAKAHQGRASAPRPCRPAAAKQAEAAAELILTRTKTDFDFNARGLRNSVRFPFLSYFYYEGHF